MGYINNIVEHDGVKVIIVANEEEIEKKSDEYTRQKEKLIGRTLEVQPELSEALKSFIGNIKDARYKNILSDNSDAIKSIYSKSELGNLRILQQAVWDFERLISVLPKLYTDNNLAMGYLLRLIVAMIFELKAGRVRPADVLGRRTNILLAKMDVKNHGTTPIAIAQNRYLDVDLSSTVVSDQLLVDILVKGIVNAENICNAMDESGFFADKTKMPAWYIIWLNTKSNDEELSTAYKEIVEKFANYEFTDPYELLHIFGILLWLSDEKISDKSYKDIVEECKNYLKVIFDKDQLKPLSFDEELRNNRSGHGGLGYFKHDTHEFGELYSYMNELRQAAAEKTYPDIAKQLLCLMEKDPAAFIRAIAGDGEDETNWSRIPILKYIDAELFVKSVMNMDVQSQELVLEALKMRYADDELRRRLADEYTWFNSVRAELLKLTGTGSIWHKWRINKYAEWYLNNRC